MALVSTNEGLCCDAVLRILEAEHGARREMVSRDTPAARGIEVSCYIGGQHYALEHTLIEPFPDNQYDNVLFGRVFDQQFEASLADVLKPCLAYTIAVNVYAFNNFSGKLLAAVRAALLEWARRTAPLLPEPPGRGITETRIHAEPPEVPVRVTLACHQSKMLGGRLLPQRFAPQALETLREKRLLKALQDKGPKLHAASTGDTRTVLVVENRDIAITNEDLVGEAFSKLCPSVQYPPTDIYLVDTLGADGHYVTQVRRAGVVCRLMGTKAGDWEFKAADLNDL